MLSALCLFLEHALTPLQKAEGLMHREALGENCGMTFNYAEPQTLTFWSQNCLIDLDLAFLDGEKVIQEIHLLKAQPLTTIQSTQKAQFALEMESGWFARNGVVPGDRIVWETDSPNGTLMRSAADASVERARPAASLPAR